MNIYFKYAYCCSHALKWETSKMILAERGLSKLFAIDWQPVTLYYVAVTKYLLK